MDRHWGGASVQALFLFCTITDIYLFSFLYKWLFGALRFYTIDCYGLLVFCASIQVTVMICWLVVPLYNCL